MAQPKGTLGYMGGVFNRFRSPLEKKVCNALQKWDLFPEVSYTTGYFEIDLAFPKNMLAIEIDGAAYHSSDEQKSKDQFRQDILEKEGWTFERVDGWFANKYADVLAAKILLKYFAKDFDERTQNRAKATLAVYFREIDPDLSQKLLRQAL